MAAAKRGIALILGRKRKLDPPINWHQDPFHSYPWQKKLNELLWLDPLIYADLHGSRRALRRARNVVLDWVRQNPTPDPSGFPAAWERKRAGDRLSRIAFIARRAGCRGLLDRHQAGLLIRAVERHAGFLLSDARRGGPVTNHDLLRDQGLLVAARYLSFVRGADTWRHVAVRRFKGAIDRLVDRRTGVHLEHTPGYQQKTVDHVRAFLHLLDRHQSGLERLLRRMKRVVAWFTMPDGDIVPIADTPFHKRAPSYARRATRGLHGLSGFLRDGFAVARRGHSYLATTAGYHRAAHKHADELSFDLYERHRRVIVDSGRRDHTQAASKLPGPQRTAAFTKSSFAHSTLVVDGKSFDLDRKPYGSALDAQGRGDGWFAILGHNPLIRSQGVRHQRLFLYRPGQAMVIVDRVRSHRVHTYTRYLQIGPGIEAHRHGRTIRLAAGARFRGSIWSPDARAELYRGSLHPLLGWYVAGGFNSLTPRFTEALRTRGRSERLVAAVGLRSAPVTVKPSGPHAYLVRIPGHGVQRVTAVRHGRRLRVDAHPA